MLSSRACALGALLVALAICSPKPLAGQYVISRSASAQQFDAAKAAATNNAAVSLPTQTAPTRAATTASVATPAATKAATTASAKPAARVSSIPAATEEPTPEPTPVPTPAPTVRTYAPVTVMNTDNSTTSNSTGTDNALYSVLRVSGNGVTPFNTARQTTFLLALFQVISTVDFDDMSISDVNQVYSSRRRRSLLMDDSMQQEYFYGPRRALLASADDNVADVTVEMVASSASGVPAVLQELQYSITNYTLENQLNTSGVGWGVKLMYYNITTPGGINATVKNYCRDRFGHWCLDKHKHLSSAGVRGVIAGGIVGILCVAALALLLRDLHGAHLLRGSEVVYNPQTPNLGGGPGTGKAGAGKITSLNASAVNTPSSAVGTPTGYMGGLAPVGSKVRRKSGAFTSGAVTHPASLAAAGKPTGLEEMISSPSFTRNASTTAAGHQPGL